MDPATAILEFIATIPDLVKLGQEAWTWLKSASGDDPKGYVKKVGVAFKTLNDADTEEDRQNAAKALSDAIAGL